MFLSAANVSASRLAGRGRTLFTLLMASTAMAGLLPAAALGETFVIDNGAVETVRGDGSGTRPSPWTVNDLSVGDFGEGQLDISLGGSVDAGEYMRIGAYAGSAGTVTVSGQGSSLTGGRMYVGSYGTGALTVSNGGAVVSDDALSISYRQGSAGTVTVSGEGSSLSVRKWLDIDDAGALAVTDGGAVDIGRALSVIGDGAVSVSGRGSRLSAEDLQAHPGVSLSVSAGGVVTIRDTAWLGYRTPEAATVTVSGAGSQLSVGKDLLVGGSNAGGPEGVGELVVSDGGLVDVGGKVSLGYRVGSSGTLTVSGPGSRVVAGHISIGSSAAGELVVSDGGLVDVGEVLLGDELGASGTVSVSGSGSQLSAEDAIAVGVFGTGSLDIRAGGTAAAGNHLEIGAAVGSTGTVTVSGTGSQLSASRNAYIGYEGSGTLAIADGGAVRVGNRAFAGRYAGSEGIVTVSGAGSLLSVAQNMTVGDSGTGALSISDGGAVSIDGVLDIAAQDLARGAITVSGAGATLTAASGLIFGSGEGRLDVLDGAKMYAGGLYLGYGVQGVVTVSGADARLVVDGIIDITSTQAAQLRLEVAAGGSLAATDVLLAGPDGNPASISIAGVGSRMDVSGELRVGYSGSGRLDVTDGGAVAAGTLVVGAGCGPGCVFGTGSLTVSGAGSRLSADRLEIGRSGRGDLVLAEGSVTEARVVQVGAENGDLGTLYFGNDESGAAVAAGRLQGLGGGAVAVAFGAGGGDIVFRHTSTDLVLDGVFSGTGHFWNMAGVTSLVGDFSQFTGEVEVLGGTLSIDADFGHRVTVRSGGTLAGGGTAGNTFVANGGHIAPGSGHGVGTLTFDGFLGISAASELDFKLGRPGASATTWGVSDTIAVSGDLTLDGLLNLLPSGDAADGEMGAGYYRLMTYGGPLTDNGLDIGSTGSLVAPSFEVTAGDGRVDLFVAAVGDDVLQTYTGGQNGVWDAGSTTWLNQNGNTPAAWAGHVAVFNQAAGGTVTVAGTQTFQGLQFVTGDMALGGDVLEVSSEVTQGVSNGEIRVLSGVTASIANAITGSGGIAKTQGGRLVLSGNNSFTGGVAVLGGVLEVSEDANLGAAAGGLTLDGGTLATTGDFVTLRDVTLGAGNGAIDVAADTRVLVGGHLLGAGGLIKQGAGTLELGVANSFGGDLQVEDGIVVGSVDAFSEADIVNAGLVVFDQTPNDTFAGTIRGLDGVDGRMEKTGTGTLTLTGTSLLDWKVEQGALVAAGYFAGNLALEGDTGFTFASDDNLRYEGTVTGDADTTLAKTGAGTVTMTADNAGFLGHTTVSTGGLAVNGTLGGTIDVLGGFLGGNGTVGAVTVHGGGTLAAGNSIGRLTVAGDLAMASGSTLEVEVNDRGEGDVVVAGAATIEGGTVHVLAANRTDTGVTYSPSSVYTVLSASGGVTGTFEDIIDDFAFLDASLDYSDDAVLVRLNRNEVGFNQVGETRNQIATAAGVESLGGGAVYDAIVTLDAASARAGFDALSGEIHATVKSGIIADTQFIRSAVNDRLRTDPETGLGLWSAGFGGWMGLDSDGNAAAFAQRSGGLIIGADQMVGDWRLGLLASYGHAGFAVDDRSSTGDADSYTVGAYGSRDLGALHLRGGISYGWHDIGTDRTVAVGSFADSLSADYAASSLQAYGEIGYSIDTELATFEPFIGLANVSVFNGSYGEAGGAAALHGGGTVSNVTYATLGLRAERAITLGETKGKAHAMVGWQHAFGETGPSTSHSFAGGDSFTVTGAGLNADTAVVEAGVDFELNDSTTIGLSYNGQFGSAGASHAVKASLRVRF